MHIYIIPNKIRVLELAGIMAAIGAQEDAGGEYVYNQRQYGIHLWKSRSSYLCGSPGCISGWACYAAGVKSESYPETAAREWLGLSRTQASRLFAAEALLSPRSEYRDLDAVRVRPEEAAKVLTHLALTGDVDWGVARRR